MNQELVIGMDAQSRLHRPPSEELDRITRTAARLFNMPMALITLLDQERQWFRSRCGIDLEETARDISFCAHAIEQQEPLVVPDARKDPRFRSNPLVTGYPNIRFYAGQTLRSRSGEPLGTLCVLDSHPHKFSQKDTTALMDLAKWAEHHLHLEEAQSEAASARSALDRQQRLFTHIIDQAEVGIALLDEHGVLVQCNRRFGTATRRDLTGLPGTSFASLIDPRDVFLAERSLSLARSTPDMAPHLILRFHRNDKVSSWSQVGLSSLPPEAGMLGAVVAVATDINDLHQAKEHLLALRDDLESRIQIRSHELDETVAELRGEILRREEIQARLALGQAQLQRVLADTSDAFIEIDGSDRIVTWNSSAERIFGWSADEAIGKTFRSLVLPGDTHARHVRWLRRLHLMGISTRMKQRIEITCVRRDGDAFPVDLTFSTSFDGGNFLVHGFMQDISKRKADEAAILETTSRLKTITDNVPAMIAHIGADYRYRFHNYAYTAWFGIGPEGLVGTHLKEFWGEELFDRFHDVLERVMAGGKAEIEYALETKAGAMWFHANLVPHAGKGDSRDGFYLLSQDITERQRLYARVEHEALHDHLTGLPNRRALMSRLNDAMARADRSGRGLALMFLDLDGFKQINDTLGHEHGDAVLQRFAESLSTLVRKTDFVSRLAGDEFVVVLEDVTNLEGHAAEFAQAISHRIAVDDVMQTTSIRLSSSIGVVAYDRDRDHSPRQLLARADHAMYEAKAQGKRRAVVR